MTRRSVTRIQSTSCHEPCERRTGSDHDDPSLPTVTVLAGSSLSSLLTDKREMQREARQILRRGAAPSEHYWDVRVIRYLRVLPR
jgi:hypothetical protein